MSEELQYVIRKSWDDVKSQQGITYNFLSNAQKACDKLDGYKVFDSNGTCVYPETVIEEETDNVENAIIFAVGDYVQVLPNTTFENNKTTEHLLNEKLIIRNLQDNNCTIARNKKGPVLGTISMHNLIKYTGENLSVIEPYAVQMLDSTPVYQDANSKSRVIKTLPKFSLYTIINEKNGFGKLKVGAGWLDLSKVNRL